jgi:DNA invertase Pin-like site-specific DNA recombinase
VAPGTPLSRLAELDLFSAPRLPDHSCGFFLRAGDVLVVKRLDRLARSMGDLQDIVRGLQAKDASLAILDQNIDTGSATGKAFLNMLGTFAEFENDLRRERQIEGIREAQLAGRYKGRPATLDTVQIEKLRAEGMGASAIAERLNIARSSVYRVLDLATSNSNANVEGNPVTLISRST